MQRFLRRVIATLSDDALADAIVGDLTEQRQRHAQRSSVAALWFWRLAAGVVIYMLIERGRAVVGQAMARVGSRGGHRGELRQALRSLRRTPWYALTIIGVIALTIALATTVFAIIDGVLFKPLPYPRASELYTIHGPTSTAKSLQDMSEWAAAVPEIELAAYQGVWEIGAERSGGRRRLRGTAVGPRFFDVLGQRPSPGGFRDLDFEPAAGDVPVLISDALWRRSFGADPSVISTSFELAGAVNHMMMPLPGFRIAGVLPRDFVFPDSRDTPDMILPIALTAKQAADRNWSYARVLARIRPDLSTDVVTARLDAVAATQGFRDNNAETGNPPGRIGVRLSTLASQLVIGKTQGFGRAFAVTALLVVLAAVNVAALGFARRRQRRRDQVLRRALGAGSWQLIRNALVEAVPLVAAGTGLGFLLAPALLNGIADVLPPRLSLLRVPGIDWRVAAFAALSGAVLLGVIASTCGAARPPMTAALGSGIRSPLRRGRWPSAVVAGQIALTVTLTIGGTLGVASVWWAWQQDPGVDTRALLIEVDTPAGANVQRSAVFASAVQRLGAIQGVRALGVAHGGLLQTRFLSTRNVIDFEAIPLRNAELVLVGGEFFDALGITLVRGRLPRPDELKAETPVAVLSDSLARGLWPDADPLGQMLKTRAAPLQVIGIVKEARFGGLDATRGQIYMPGRPSASGGILVVGADRDPDNVLAAILRELDAMGPAIGVTRASTVADAFANLLLPRSFDAWLLGGFAAAALVITTVGITGLVAMLTAGRTREIGVRCALGACPGEIARQLIIEQGVAVAGGLGCGALLTWWALGYVRLSLFQFSAYDARLWAIAIAVVIAASAAGASVPALRASRIDPVAALRAE